jgi:hypothetical protein
VQNEKQKDKFIDTFIPRYAGSWGFSDWLGISCIGFVISDSRPAEK